PNFAVEAETGMALCHSQCGRGWDMIGLEMELAGTIFPAAKKAVYALVGRPEPSWSDAEIQATYDYCREDGTVAYQVVRKCGKKFFQRRPDGKGGWIWGLGDNPPLPFHLPELLKGKAIWIVEGEKDVLTMERHGKTATSNNGGAGNFSPELAPWFAGKRVAILPDNDEPGRRHALLVAATLQPVAKSIRIVELPGLPEHGDVTDFLAIKGNRIEHVSEAYARAQDWTVEWVFAFPLKHEGDKYIRTLEDEIRAEGGMERFWDFRLHEGVATPFSKLTSALGGGMRAGEVYVLGADQGTGKTSLALQFALTAIRKRHGVLMYSLEMGWRDVFQRLVAIEAKVDLLEYQLAQRRGGLVDADAKELSAACRELMQYRLLVNVRCGVTPEYLVEECQRLKKNERIDLVIVDHMQLMATTGSVRGDYEKFTAISRAMKDTAKAIDCPILLVSQTSRNAAHQHRVEPEVSDLRGSGAIEEDAAAVFLLYPDKEDVERTLASSTFAKGPVKTWLKLGKNRYGLTGLYLELSHFKRFTRFELTAKEQEYGSEN
ncbi:MAG: DnaB-like helicase C-terminal domain-containing protein, partial [Planctomycetota bacterium]